MKKPADPQNPFPPEKEPPFWPEEPPPNKTGQRPIQPDHKDDDLPRSGIPPTAG